MALSEVNQGNLNSADELFMQSFVSGSYNIELLKIYVDALVSAGFPEHVPALMSPFIEIGAIDYELGLDRIAIIYRYGTLEQALAELESLILLFPDNPDLSLYKGGLLSELGMIKEVNEHYQSMLEMYPDSSVDIYLRMIKDLEFDKQGREDLFVKAINANPESEILQKYYISFLISVDEIQKALKLADSRDEGLEEPIWFQQVIQQLLERNQLITARDLIKNQFKDKQITVTSGYYYIGIYAELGDLERAGEVALQLVSDYPSDEMAAALLGHIQLSVGDCEKAVATLEPLMDSKNARLDWLWDLVEAKTTLFPDIFDFSKTNDNLSIQRESIRKLLSQASDLISPTDSRECLLVGVVSQSMGEFRKSIHPLEQATLNPNYSRQAYLSLSIAYQELNDSEMNIKILEAAAKQFSDDALILNALGYSYAELNQELQRAKKLVMTALEIDPNNPAYLDSLGWIYFQENDYTLAFDYLVRASNGLPEDPVILEHLGRCLIQMGKQAKAIPVLQRAIYAGGDSEVLNSIIDEIKETQ
jgi:tetratricopeptide (TPR) repeat protein